MLQDNGTGELISNSTTAEQPQSSKRLAILRVIKEAQQKHGLRQGNYLRYRGYCARRVRRIRRSLKFTHSHKSIPNRTAKFTLRPVTAEAIIDSRYLEVVLFDAERDWAYALQLKFEMGDDVHSRKRFHMRQKLRRAVKWGRSLEVLTKQCETVETITKLEAQAYSAFIRATLCVEMANWRKATELFKTVNKIYEKLSSSVKDPELVELYLSRCREVQNPLRLCEYNYQQEGASAGGVDASTAVVAPTTASVQMIGGEELDLDFNKLAFELNKSGQEAETEQDATSERATRSLLEQLKRDWRSVDPQKVKTLKPSAALLRSLPSLQPMPCKPMFFDLAIHHLKTPISAEQLEGKKKKDKLKDKTSSAVKAKSTNSAKETGGTSASEHSHKNSPKPKVHQMAKTQSTTNKKKK